MAEFDPWALTSGMVDDFTCDINDAVFEFDLEYNDGESLVLKLDIQSDDLEVGREGNGSDTLLVPVGKGWETGDKGKTCRHESGKDRNFNNQSGIGLLIESAVKIDDLRDLLQKRGDPRDASLWVGLNVDFHREAKTFESNGETITYRRPIIVGFNGEKGAAKSAAKSESPAAKAAGDTNTATDAPAAGDGNLSAANRLKLKAIAKDHDTHDAFVEAALTSDKIDADALESYIVDEAFYAELRG